MNNIYVIMCIISFGLAVWITHFFYKAKNGILRLHMIGLFSVLAWKCGWDASTGIIDANHIYLVDIVSTIPLTITLLILAYFFYHSLK